MEMLEDWREEDSLKEEQINIEELLHTTSQEMRNVNPAVQSQAASQSADLSQGLMIDTQTYKLPTFYSSANRPSVLDLSTTTMKSEMAYSTNNLNGHSPHHTRASPSPHHHQQQQQHMASPHSPHHSPYVSNQQVFNYNNLQQQQHSPVSPHPQQQMHSPVSPHTQRSVSPHSHVSVGDHNSPLSPHMQQMAPSPMSPHSTYAPMANRSVSPHPQHSPHHPVSPLSPHQQVPHQGAMSPHHPGMHGASGGAVSPHHMTAGGHMGSVSPVHRQHSPAPGASSVFGRYAGGSPVSMHSGNSSDTESYYGYSEAQLAELRKRGINVDKGSDMYKAKRERNNVAVRKSREKKKQREQETEKRVKELSDENSALQNKLDIAVKEMNLLKNLYKNIGVQLPPEARSKLENELSKFK